jgi:hypothetical protein
LLDLNYLGYKFDIIELTDEKLTITDINTNYVNHDPQNPLYDTMYLQSAPTEDFEVLKNSNEESDTGCVSLIPALNYYTHEPKLVPDTCELFNEININDTLLGKWQWGDGGMHPNEIEFNSNSVVITLRTDIAEPKTFQGIWTVKGDSLYINAKRTHDDTSWYYLNILRIHFTFENYDRLIINNIDDFWLSFDKYNGEFYETFRYSASIVVCDENTSDQSCLYMMNRVQAN